MGQRLSEVERMLADAGFTFEGYGRHKVWRKGAHVVNLHFGTKGASYEVRRVRSVIRKATEPE